MDPIHPSELPNALSLLPGYPNVFLGKRLWLIISCQVAICIISSIIMSYLMYRKFYSKGNKSWKKAVEIMGPIKKRLQNLEKERVIWNSYIEWIEDYCTVYYGLLNYLNCAVTDLDKLYKDRDMTLRNLHDSSMSNSQSDLTSNKGGDSVLSSVEISCEGVTSEEDVQFVANMVRVFANLKPIEVDRSGSGDIKKEEEEEDVGSTMSSGVSSKKDLREESDRDEIDSLKSSRDYSDEEPNLAESLEMLFHEKKNCAKFREQHPDFEEVKIAEECK